MSSSLSICINDGFTLWTSLVQLKEEAMAWKHPARVLAMIPRPRKTDDSLPAGSLALEMSHDPISCVAILHCE
jgi:hypothetical protein